MKRERLEFLLDVRYTRRFARYVGGRCASETIKDVAKELLLGWDAVNELDKMHLMIGATAPGGPRCIAAVALTWSGPKSSF